MRNQTRAPTGQHLRFAVAAMLVYGALTLPILAMHRFDLSNFVVAGDAYADAAQMTTPIMIRHHTEGYDGQFYYRLAVDPWSFAPTVNGVHFDQPAYRAQRIAYPAMAWAISLGVPSRVPAVLFGLNLAGMGVLALLAASLCASAAIAPGVALAILLWPGFIVALTHDTAEIMAAVFVLTAILGHVRDRPALYGSAAALAMLTRETTLPVFAGVVLYDLYRSGRGDGRWTLAIGGMLAVLPFLAWRAFLLRSYGGVSDQGAAGLNLGLPFVGAVRNLVDCLTGARPWASSPLKDAGMRAIVLFTAPLLLAFCAVVATRLIPAIRGGGRLAPLAVAWLLVGGLMSLLTAGGPWIDPVGYSRAFTECYVVGCLVLGSVGWRKAHQRALLVTGLVAFAAVWVVCVVQLRVT